eukprot:CAMPEP_0171874780 /NCGR_PEP_ID=MMETSP0992-20121227/35170_1 /TAXON_ID=483369 /ORGANISM="non described non described, Strain CCMP2098" /LENGTH=41 /DNA_ID= /DNA_START= /DNA_END= /DNA_ORIENTATION=
MFHAVPASFPSFFTSSFFNDFCLLLPCTANVVSAPAAFVVR